MSSTNVRGQQIKDGSVQRVDLDIATAGQAVIRKIIQGTGIQISSTGVDAGTGDVTINLDSPVTIAHGGTGQITQQAAINALTAVAGATNEYVLTKDTATGDAIWKASVPGSGMLSLNGLTDTDQFLLTGTSGTDFNISSSSPNHTFNIPSASATARGLITTGTQTIAGDKNLTGTTDVALIRVSTAVQFTSSNGDLYQNTADASDNKRIRIGGGGDVANSRGGFIELLGNESTQYDGSGGGQIVLRAGNVANGYIRVETAATNRWTFEQAGDLTPYADNTYKIGNSSALLSSLWTRRIDASGSSVGITIATNDGDINIEAGNSPSARWIYFKTNGSVKWVMNDTGKLESRASSTGLIGMDTSDGTDNKALILFGGGGSGSSTRGAQLLLAGNEYSGNTGNVYLDSGAVTGATVSLRTFGSTGSVNLTNNGVINQSVSESEITTLYNSITSKEKNVSVQTTDATVTSLYTLTLADNTSYTFDVSILGRRSSTTAMGVGGKLRFVVYRNNAGAATLAADFSGALKEIESWGSSGYDFTVDVSSNDVRIRVTGAAAQTVNWAANVRYVQVT